MSDRNGCLFQNGRSRQDAPDGGDPDEKRKAPRAALWLTLAQMAEPAYGAGLRIGEVLAPEVSDIDNKRMLIRVKDGKTGGQGRRS